MNKKYQKILKILYQKIDNAHFFTSLQVPGLCVASNSLEFACWDVSFQLMNLTKIWYIPIIGIPGLCDLIEESNYKTKKYKWIKYNKNA